MVRSKRIQKYIDLRNKAFEFFDLSLKPDPGNWVHLPYLHDDFSNYYFGEKISRQRFYQLIRDYVNIDPVWTKYNCHLTRKGRINVLLNASVVPSYDDIDSINRD